MATVSSGRLAHLRANGRVTGPGIGPSPHDSPAQGRIHLGPSTIWTVPDCRGYRTTRRNLPSSIAYRPPFTAISRNIGVIDMQTSHTTASAAATPSLARRIVAASWKPVLFAVLMWLSAAAGEIPIQARRCRSRCRRSW